MSTFGSLAFWVSFAARTLRRDGQRSALAVGCIAFGVLSLVGLLQLAHIIESALLIPPRIAQGGDLILRRAGGIGPDAIDGLRWLPDGAYAGVVRARTLLLRPAASGRVTIVSQAFGIDAERFPLVDEARFVGSDGLDLPLEELLAPLGSAVVTADLAERVDLAPGDRFFLFGSPESPPIELEVAGVARLTPDRRGHSVYFGLDTARERGLGDWTHVVVRDDRPEAVATRLETAGWEVERVPEVATQTEAKLFRFMLGGAGILGLLLGGIGVSNTMQVLLARRRVEIATLKALGFRRVHLFALFGLEAAGLGIAGSLIGAVLGLLLANGLMGMLRENLTFLLSYSVDVPRLVGAMVVGVATALIFGAAAIVRAGHVRPSLLLRDAPVDDGRAERALLAAMYGVLLTVFALLSSLVLGSLARGFGVVLLGGVGLLVLGAFLALVSFAVVRIPTGRVPLLGMAMRNLRHRPLRSIHGLVALFVGVIAIGAATVVLHDADLRMDSRRVDLTGVNLRVYADLDDEARVVAELIRLGGTGVHVDRYRQVEVFASGEPLPDTITSVGRDADELRWNLSLVDSLADDTSLDPAYLMTNLAEARGFAVGDTLLVRDGSREHEVVLAGTFAREGSGLDLAAAPPALIVPASVHAALRRDDDHARTPVQIHASIDEVRLEEVADALGRAVPTAMVLGKDAIADVIQRIFRGLFWFVVAVAALALLAGVVLVANSVGLSMLERRRELGVLKALGYGRGQVMATVVLENLITGAIGGISGVIGLWIAIPLINRAATGADLALSPLHAIVLIVIAVSCAVVAAMVAAWGTVRQRPAFVLREG